MRSGEAKIVLTVQTPNHWGVDNFGMAVDIGEFPVFSEMFVDELRVGLFLARGNPIEETAKVLKEREFRRDILMKAAKVLAHRLGDYIEDAEGWHGERRRKKIVGKNKSYPT